MYVGNQAIYCDFCYDRGIAEGNERNELAGVEEGVGIVNRRVSISSLNCGETQSQADGSNRFDLDRLLGVLDHFSNRKGIAVDLDVKGAPVTAADIAVVVGYNFGNQRREKVAGVGVFLVGFGMNCRADYR